MFQLCCYNSAYIFILTLFLKCKRFVGQFESQISMNSVCYSSKKNFCSMSECLWKLLPTINSSQIFDGLLFIVLCTLEPLNNLFIFNIYQECELLRANIVKGNIVSFLLFVCVLQNLSSNMFTLKKIHNILWLMIVEKPTHTFTQLLYFVCFNNQFSDIFWEGVREAFKLPFIWKSCEYFSALLMKLCLWIALEVM